MDKVCRDFMNHKCSRNPCNYIHDNNLCYGFWKGGACKWGANCKKNHFVSGEGENNGVLREYGKRVLGVDQ